MREDIEQYVKKLAQDVKAKRVTPYHVPDSGIWYECNACGRGWTVDVRSGQRQPNGYWKCPEGSNEDA